MLRAQYATTDAMLEMEHNTIVMAIDFISDINKDLAADLHYGEVDRFMVKVLWWHLGVLFSLVILNAVVKLASFYPSPLSWRVISIPEAIAASVFALLATLIPVFLVAKIKNHYAWRAGVTVALVVYSYLFVFISGGSIEMHFHFFMIAALLVIYADWRLGWILLLFTGLHHGILNYVEPGWVYYYGRNDFSVVAHAIPVLVTVIFTTYLCATYRSSFVLLKDSKVGLIERTKELETTTSALEKLKSGLELTVADKTSELNGKLSELEKINQMMIDRELKMVELKKEIELLKGQTQSA